MHTLARQRALSAFTLIELATVLVIVAILALLIAGGVGKMQGRIEKLRCIGNLKNLHIAAQRYVEQNGHWPQVNPRLLQGKKKDTQNEYDRKWIEALTPFGAPRETWMCPTVNRMAGIKDPSRLKIMRADYRATPFDANRFTPFKWNTQPWFVESNDLHGDGNLIIFPDGRVQGLKEVNLRGGR